MSQIERGDRVFILQRCRGIRVLIVDTSLEHLLGSITATFDSVVADRKALLRQFRKSNTVTIYINGVKFRITAARVGFLCGDLVRF